jgi:hypothetical protein
LGIGGAKTHGRRHDWEYRYGEERVKEREKRFGWCLWRPDGHRQKFLYRSENFEAKSPRGDRRKNTNI